MSNLEPIFYDAFNLFCGEKIGSGVYRDVYECRVNPDLVVKVEIVPEGGWRTFSNVAEMKFWNEYSHSKSIARWLAPCEYLSPDGYILLQRRCEPVTRADLKRLPTRLPEFLEDIKLENFGWLNGKLVCVDYAINTLEAMTKLKKVTWE